MIVDKSPYCKCSKKRQSPQMICVHCGMAIETSGIQIDNKLKQAIGEEVLKCLPKKHSSLYPVIHRSKRAWKCGVDDCQSAIKELFGMEE